MAKKLTKKRRFEIAREIIDRNTIDVPFSCSDVEQLAEVCQAPVDGAVRKVNPQFPNSDPRHLHTLVDGEWAARSWRKWIDSVTPEQEAKKAMRFVVREDMRDFLDAVGGDAYCQWCGSSEDLTVDHSYVPFDDIANSYIEARGLPKVCEHPSPNIVVNVIEDPNTEAEWIAHHASLAEYQILCRSCNSSKGKR